MSTTVHQSSVKQISTLKNPPYCVLLEWVF